MSAGVGIGFAFVAMLCWGIGDFLIQRSTRRIGDWETLFIITLFGSLILLPFVYRSIPALFFYLSRNLWILVSSGLILACASLLIFEGFKKGKISVLEPILSVEIPAASFLAFLVLRDMLSWEQIALIVFLIIGLCLISFREKRLTKKMFMEKGIWLVLCGSFLMGFADFLLGWGSRVTDPLAANFVLNIVMTLIAGIYLLTCGRVRHTVRDIAANRGALLAMSICDNVAWIAYAFAMALVPIAVATGLSESSIIIAVLLGLFVSGEKLQRHQKIGLAISFLAVLWLAAVTSG